MPDDNWEHRSEGMRCMTCVFYVPKMIRSGKKSKGVESALGRCRANAPTMKGYPAVFETDWCGNHKLDENKI